MECVHTLQTDSTTPAYRFSNDALHAAQSVLAGAG